MSFLSLSLQAPGAAEAAGWLGAAVYGEAQALPGAVHVPMPLLATSHTSLLHAWHCDGTLSEGRLGAVAYRRSEDFLFGVLSLPEAGRGMQALGFAAYRDIFACLEREGMPQLLRFWNYLPRINEAEGGMERYREFNVGRQDAFIEGSHPHLAGSPSACALGCGGDALVVYFLASRHAPLAIENPRQLSAWSYPQQYGPRAPTFSRASLLQLPAQEVLFISGTASILGHESVHPGDVAAQTQETLRNIEAVLSEANRRARHGSFAARDLTLKVFVRHAADVVAVQHVLETELGKDLNVMYLRADVCRAELLVEIEAFGFLGAAA
ncbi:hypothetical protein [Uliginosibacterium sp. TH139]|uniref:chorismate transformation enzyme, FkbO/Hyg5 family n=1 Tax=Uliginosibacterium sp. TH139 TaxID=2067453 RepID=UPI0020B149DB|nr:hypothetical protein [Uliginosibacterium sp. TH139]